MTWRRLARVERWLTRCKKHNLRSQGAIRLLTNCHRAQDRSFMTLSTQATATSPLWTSALYLWRSHLLTCGLGVTLVGSSHRNTVHTESFLLIWPGVLASGFFTISVVNSIEDSFVRMPKPRPSTPLHGHHATVVGRCYGRYWRFRGDGISDCKINLIDALLPWYYKRNPLVANLVGGKKNN